MITVYVLTHNTHDGRDFLGVFGTREQAEIEQNRYLENPYYAEYNMSIGPWELEI